MDKDKENQKRQREELMEKVYRELIEISGEVEELNKIRLNGFNKMDINIAELENSLNRGFKMISEKQTKIEEKNKEVKELLNKIAKNLGDVEH
ncbi:hypothetical protein [Priestia megaterium]|uniref:hypothetical protein n=1 Tax=Priestia megaterium TaxID=1404 RepID=UPI001EDC7A23|nr:hypothetical protein [Priestia megaterium]MDR7246323.1 hypothetical protein [Priestia megaterium]UKJ81186.1 hypothetical protein H1W83_02245 [Priestia megaterium]